MLQRIVNTSVSKASTRCLSSAATKLLRESTGMGNTVVKFGGSSVADAAQVSRVLDIVKADPTRRFVVVSAPGKRFDGDTKVTDRLYQCHELAGQVQDGAATRTEYEATFDQTVRERYLEIATGLGLTDTLQINALHSDLDVACRGIYEVASRGGSADYAASRGEHLCAAMLGRVLKWDFVDAADDFIHFDEHNMLDALTTHDSVAERLSDVKSKPQERVLIPGFYGRNAHHEVCTFSRGGSDITGSIVAAALQSPEAPVLYENWTDVAGVYSTDPRAVPHARPISQLSYEDLFALADAGAGVLHPAAVAPAMRTGVPIHIKNTNSPMEPGTIVDVDEASLQAMRTGSEAVVGLVGNYAAQTAASKISVVCRSAEAVQLVQTACTQALAGFPQPQLSDLIQVVGAGDRSDFEMPSPSASMSHSLTQPEFNEVLTAVYDAVDQQGMLLR